LKIYNATEKGKAVRKAKYERDKRVYKNSKLLRDFGITIEQYEAKLLAQGGGCAICKRTPEENKKMLAVDHDHTTGKNRDLLCGSCNICIGFLEKNKLSPLDLQNYLTKHNYGIPSH
jgi:hypothetical protein